MSNQYRTSCEVFGLFCLSVLFFTWGIASQEVIGFDSRFYLFALEMWQKGPSFFPTTYFQPYPDYPATSTILINLFAKAYGGLDKYIAVLPSAIAASVTVVMTYLIGCLHNKRWGIYAVVFLLMTITFFKSARSIALDMFPTMVTTGCFYLIYSADRLNRHNRYWWIYPLLFIGFAFRGPIGLIMPTGVICAYYLIDHKYKKFLVTGLIALALLLCSTAVLLWFAYLTGGQNFMHDVLRMQMFGRLNNHSLPFHDYFTKLSKKLHVGGQHKWISCKQC